MHKKSWAWNGKSDEDEFIQNSEKFLNDVEKIELSVGNIFGELVDKKWCFIPVVLENDANQVWEYVKNSNLVRIGGKKIETTEIKFGNSISFGKLKCMMVLWNDEKKRWYRHYASYDTMYECWQKAMSNASFMWNEGVQKARAKVDLLGNLIRELNENLQSMKTEINIMGHADSYRDGKEAGYQSCIDDVDIKFDVTFEDMMYWEMKKIDFDKLVAKFVEVDDKENEN